MRTFLVAAVSATILFSNTAFSQQLNQNAASIPDYSGVWVHPSWPGFEPPVSGPGPVANRSRLPNGAGNSNRLVGDDANPILKPAAAEVVKQHGEISLRGEGYPTPANQCWPQPVPYIFWTIGVQLLQQPDKVTILYSNPDHEFRQIRLNGSHPVKVAQTWYGDSVGHYEGDTLVVDTVGVKTGRPFAMVDIYGTPYSEALHVVERYRLVDYETAMEGQRRNLTENIPLPFNDSGLFADPDYKGTGLELQFIVDDENVFTIPWSATMTYRRAAGNWPEFVCSENTYWYSGREAMLPRADEPDF